MNILFLGYWGAKEGLSASTIYPHLKILSSFGNIEQIIYCSIERDGWASELDLGIPKVTHIPLLSGKGLKDKFADFTKFPRQLIELIKKYSIEKMVCRGAPAGALGYLVWKKAKVPFYVESFEPHADYMLESGVWKKWDPRYLLEAYWEEKQKRHATALMPVANNYKKRLEEEGVDPKKIYTIPCCVPIDAFAFREQRRQAVRKELGWNEDDIIGIYVGKFGGIYYEKEAYELFAQAHQYWEGKFRLIILSPQNANKIKTQLKERGINNSDVYVGLVPHHKVPEFLSASDFAFSTIKPAKSRWFCSAIKNGEYWANGLPILLTYGVGDDTSIIEENKDAGAHFYANRANEGLQQIDEILQNSSREERFTKLNQLAKSYRGFRITKEVYQKLYT